MIYLEKIIPEQNQYRFYSIQITQTLFGNWALVRVWGRIGSEGSRLESWYEDLSETQLAAKELQQVKQKRGYEPKHNQGV